VLVKPFYHIIKEKKSNESKTYLGSVEDNNDPQKLGRLKIRVPMYDDLNVEDIPWAFPILSTFLGNSPNAISFSVPNIGSQVRVSFPTGDKLSPFYTGAELNSINKSTFFDEDYPACYGVKDEKGNFIKVNRANGTTVIQHSSTTNITIIADGSYTVTSPDGTSFHCDSIGNFTMDGKTLTINTKATLINSDVSIRMTAPTIVADGNLGTTSGATGSFSTTDGSQVTVANGIVQNIGR